MKSNTNSKRSIAELSGDDATNNPKEPKRANAEPQSYLIVNPLHAPTVPTMTLDRAQLDFFAAHGYVVVPDVLSGEELQLLQLECALLFQHLHADKDRAAAKVIEQMREDAEARVDAAAYLRARESQFSKHCGGEHVALESNKLLVDLLFGKLPSYAAALMRTDLEGKSGESDQSGHQHTCSSSINGLLFFNEHYVVKPPQTAVEFRWHQDDEEQLGMCVHRSSIAPYLSAWCALDDITLSNGPLRFVSQQSLTSEAFNSSDDTSDHDNNSGPVQLESSQLDAFATDPILAAAGTVIFFLSNVWHCSSCNESETMRRAFYAQYSTSRIKASPRDPWPLSFAIPCQLATERFESKPVQRRLKVDNTQE